MSAIDFPDMKRRVERRAEGGARSPGASRRGPAWTVACLALVTVAVFAIYARVLSAPLLFDDWVSVDNSPSITRLWPLLGDHENPGPLNPPKYTPTAGRPLVNYSFALNYYFGETNPVGYRCVNILMHILSAVLLGAIVRRTLLLDYFASRYEAVAGPLSLAVALLWAVHPLHTETIAYVTQRTELLMGLCYFATLYGALRYWTTSRQSSRAMWLAFTTLACLGGMASKEVMVTAPVIVLLYERTFLTGSFRRALRQSWPLYVGLALGWGLLLALNYDGPRSKDSGFGLGVAAHIHWLTQTKVLLMYFGLTVWPWPLVIHYEIPRLATVPEALPWLLPVSVFAILTVVLVWRRSAAGFLAAWIWLVSSPTLVVPVITEFAAERRMYLPLAAIATLVVVGGYLLICRFAERRSGSTDRAKIFRWSLRPLLVAVAAVVVALSVVGAHRLGAYETGVSIWSDAVQYQPLDPTVRGNLGLALVDAGRPEEAVEHLDIALKLRPDAEAHSNLARAMLTHVNRPQEAIKLYQWVIDQQPKNADARSNLGIALLQAGRAQEAVQHCAEAVRLKPDSVEVQYNMGVTLASAGRPAEAISHYREALRLRPRYVVAHLNLGNILLQMGQTSEAIEHYQQAIQFKPDYADAHANLGTAQLRLGNTADAIAHLREALRLQPDFPEAYYNLAMALAARGQLAESVQQFEAALAIKPDYAEAWANLATAHARQDRSADAIAAAEKALQFARAQGNAMLLEQIETWLRVYRASLNRQSLP